MSGSKDSFLGLLKVLTKSFEGLSEEQYEKLLTGQARLVYQDLSTTAAKAPAKKAENKVDLSEYIDRLPLFSSREEAKAYLRDSKLRKQDLGDIAKHFKVHILKSDKRDKMIDKIVETVVGARLRSDAIRDTDLKGGPAIRFSKL